MHEDAAAKALAAAFVPDPEGQGLVLTAPFTGRVNLLARGPGVAVLDVAAIEAVNRIHPMITIATVPAFQQMQDGGMVATIKIISYAVPQAALKAACEAAQAALRLARPALNSVRLIVTDIDGGPGDKGWKSIADRVAAFGLSLDAPSRAAHTTSALARALSEETAELTLILTGSATSDIHDVAPSAVVAAGGRVERFGMPVDPGNLLFIGQLPGGMVIGLPGCARAPALNGADWVLARVLCGVEVTGYRSHGRRWPPQGNSKPPAAAPGPSRRLTRAEDDLFSKLLKILVLNEQGTCLTRHQREHEQGGNYGTGLNDREREGRVRGD